MGQSFRLCTATRVGKDRSVSVPGETNQGTGALRGRNENLNGSRGADTLPSSGALDTGGCQGQFFMTETRGDTTKGELYPKRRLQTRSPYHTGGEGRWQGSLGCDTDLDRAASPPACASLFLSSPNTCLPAQLHPGAEHRPLTGLPEAAMLSPSPMCATQINCRALAFLLFSLTSAGLPHLLPGYSTSRVPSSGSTALRKPVNAQPFQRHQPGTYTARSQTG